MIGGRIIGAIVNGARNGFPVLHRVGDALFAPGAPGHPATETEPAEPPQPKGVLRSRTVWAVVFALGCRIAIMVGIEESWVNAALQVAELAGISAAGYYRVIATVPTRGSRPT